jgi:Mlc titration factor MtfA (ptsG expression regulator)
MFRLLRRFFDRADRPQDPIDEADWSLLLDTLPVLRGLSFAESQRLRLLTTTFLRQKRFEPVSGFSLSRAMRLRIAAQACLPILNLDATWYDPWRTIIVYPDEFVRPQSKVDDNGIVHEWSEVLSGESWDRGPIVLSWADVVASDALDGYNVVMHEMAHQLDGLNGDTDGFPPLHREMSIGCWTRSFRCAFDTLGSLLDRCESPPIDAYAAESPAEFFAVLSEYFFELPGSLRRAYPEVYDRLVEFYRQDPANRLDELD